LKMNCGWLGWLAWLGWLGWMVGLTWLLRCLPELGWAGLAGLGWLSWAALGWLSWVATLAELRGILRPGDWLCWFAVWACLGWVPGLRYGACVRNLPCVVAALALDGLAYSSAWTWWLDYVIMPNAWLGWLGGTAS
jgi:hypothetical protein